MKLKIIFQNLYHGMLFAGEKEGIDIFYKYNPSAYIDYYQKFNPNIVCLAEIPLDDEFGNGEFISAFSRKLELPYFKVYVNEKSWILEGKYYGTAILSKFPIKEYESFNLPNPKLEIDQKDGTHWIMHDKGAQKMTLDINGQIINIFNLHYFPFHRFDRKINEPEFKDIRQQLSKILLPSESEVSIIAGNFNNKGLEIEEAFPELFELNNIQRALTFDRADYEKNFEGDSTQIEHILYTPKFLKLINSNVEVNYSDHPGLTATFELVL